VRRAPGPVAATPYLVGLALLVGLPLIAAVGLAFTEFSGVDGPRFNGLANFRRMLDDPAFLQALGNSACYVALAVPLRLFAVTVCALLLHRRETGTVVARTAVYLPAVIPDIAFAILWAWLLNPIYGPLPAALEAANLPSPGWLTDPWAARVAVAFMSAFQIGEGFVVALAWRRSLPARLYEQAAVDGAGSWFTLTRLTLPLMAPVLGLLALRDVLLALQAGFVPALIVTNGGPRMATTFLPTYLYANGFRWFRLGYAAALSLVILAIGLVVIALQWRLLRGLVGRTRARAHPRSTG
jgi:multiple sugar transport system permease protein